MENSKYTFFWKNKSPFSQWYGCWMDNGAAKYDGAFIIDGITYLTGEHYMMCGKAKLFGDMEMHAKILETNHPKDVKAMGRLVKNFDLSVWEANCKQIVYDGNYAKFSQNAHLYRQLMDTGDTKLIEASPYDKIWGIGLDEEAAKKIPEEQWPGVNYLGEVLTKLREDFKVEESKVPVVIG